MFLYAAVFTLLSAEIAAVLSFWPIVPINLALVMATIMYVLLALSQFHFAGRLRQRIIFEYLTVAAVVFFVILIVTRWGA